MIMETFTKNGIPKIIFGHMASPCLLFRTDYNIFRKKEQFRPTKIKNKKLKIIFKGAF